jgi:hypothetical protein
VEKRVRFAEKLDNDASLNSSMRERIEHNLRYNDDTIFDNMSIFQSMNDSGIISRPKKVKEKEKYPITLLRNKMAEEEDEEEDNHEESKTGSPGLTLQTPSLLNEQSKGDEKAMVLQDQSGGGADYWGLMAADVSAVFKNPETTHRNQG